MIYAINYDLKRPGRNYETLYAAIKSCGAWWHYLGSTWLVDTSLSASDLWARIQPHVDTRAPHVPGALTRESCGRRERQDGRGATVRTARRPRRSPALGGYLPFQSVPGNGRTRT